LAAEDAAAGILPAAGPEPHPLGPIAFLDPAYPQGSGYPPEPDYPQGSGYPPDEVSTDEPPTAQLPPLRGPRHLADEVAPGAAPPGAAPERGTAPEHGTAGTEPGVPPADPTDHPGTGR